MPKVLIMAHIYGSAPFIFPGTLGGGLRGKYPFYPLYLDLDSPTSVLTECTLFWRVTKLQHIVYFGALTLWGDREAML